MILLDIVHPPFACGPLPLTSGRPELALAIGYITALSRGVEYDKSCTIIVPIQCNT
jgi:hypothetical protein